MILSKTKKVFHRFLKAIATDKMIHLPAFILLIFAFLLFGFVYFSDTTDFTPCTVESIGCTENVQNLSKVKQIKTVFVCASKTAWCDTQALFHKFSSKKNIEKDFISTELKSKEDFSLDDLNTYFAKLDFEQAELEELSMSTDTDIDPKKLMEEARMERIEGEKNFQKLIESFIPPELENELNDKK